MKKVLSVFLAALMIFAMIPAVIAASAPAITATANKTSVSVGEQVTITVKVPANSKLVAFTYELKYDASFLQVVSGSGQVNSTFSFEEINTNTPGVVTYAGISQNGITAASTIFTIKFKVLKNNAKIQCNVVEAYTNNGGKDDTNITADCSLASTKTISFTKAVIADYFAIKTPSTTTIKHKDAIILHIDEKHTIPANAEYQWTTDNSNFKVEVLEGGKECKFTSDKNGDTKITVKLVTPAGTVLETETITLTSKAGFFDKIGSFFRGLFGMLKVYDKE